MRASVTRWSVKICAAAIVVCLWNCPSVGAQPSKRLIYLGIDTPQISDLPQIVPDLEQSPFDGWVFSVTSDSTRGRERRFDFTWENWGKRAFSQQELQPTVDTLRKTPFKRLTDNFIRVITTPGDIDWFDAQDTVVANARLAGWVAKQGGMKGIFFDPEEYVSPLWDYHKQRHASEKSFQDYAAQVRLRGADVMRAFQAEYPDITILLAFGCSYIYHKEWPAMHGAPAFAADTNDPKKLETFCYGLLAPFLDGMIEAAGPNVRLIDGTEHSYLTLRRKQFIQHRRAFEQHALPFVADDQAYKRKVRLGFGIWVDALWHRDEDERGYFDAPPDGRTKFAGWDGADFSKNYWQPDELQMSITNALRESDQYVWLYSERLFFQGSDKNLPPAYEQAIRNARKAAELPE